MSSRKYRSPVATAVVAALAALCAARGASAAWEVVPDVEITAEADDNPRLLLQEADGSARMGLDARLRLTNFGERGSAFVEPRVVSESYSDAAAAPLESEDLFLVTQAGYAWQQVEIGWRSNFREQNVLRAEFEQAIPDDVAVDVIDTGIGSVAVLDQERRRLDAAFNVDVVLSQRTTLRMELSRVDVGYSGETGVFTSLTGFDDNTVSATLSRAANERNNVSATLFVSEYHAVRNNNATNSFGVEGAFTRPLSETWTFSLTAGMERSDYQFIADDGAFVDDASANFTFLTRFEKQAERTRWRIEAGRLVTPNSTGFRSTRNQLRGFVEHDLTPRLRTSAGIRFSRLTGIEQRQLGGDRDYSRATLELEWDLSRRWSLTSSYDWVARADAEVTSNSIAVGIRYRGLRRQQ